MIFRRSGRGLVRRVMRRALNLIPPRALMFGLLACLSIGMAPAPSFAQPVCGTQNCRPETQHPINVLALIDGMGGTTWLPDVDLKGLKQAAKQACSNYEKAHSNANQTYTFDDTCAPVLPIPDAQAGGTWNSIDVSGTLRQYRNDTHETLSLFTSTWGLLSAQCTDSLNANLPSLGESGQCYCNFGLSYSKTLNACIKAIDKWADPAGICLLCTAANTPKVANPIDPLFGAKIVNETLGIRVGHESLVVVYDSRVHVPYVSPPSIVNGSSGGPASVPLTSFGGLWTTSVHKFLYIQREGASNVGFTVQAYRGDGRALTFNHPTATTYTPLNPSTRERLVPVLDASGNQTSQVRMIDSYGNIELYELGNVTSGYYGTLQSIAYATGGNVAFSYGTLTNSVTPLLTRIVDDQGRAVSLVYEADESSAGARLNHLVAPDGNSYGFTYDAQGNLMQITWPDGKARTFLYERADLPWAITGIVDENSSRFATYSYDTTGVPVSTEHADGVERYAFSYAVPPRLSVSESLNGSVLTREHSWAPPQDVYISTPSGSEQSLLGTLFAGAPALAGQAQPAGSGSAQSSSAIAYDAQGNRASFADFNGMRTCYAYDTSNRETIRIEGLTSADTGACASYVSGAIALPATARMIRTEWYLNWRLPAKVTQPRRQTIYSYNDQSSPSTTCAQGAAALPDGNWLPVLCQQVVKSTLDGNGSSSSPTVESSVQPVTTTFTYDTAGRVLTSVDANNHATTYEYYSDTAFTGADPNATGHTIGDLHTVTNAASQITTFTLYDKAGRVRHSINPKGIETDVVYTPRGWVDTISVTVAGTSRVTHYTYDNVGQLKDVSLPDGTALHHDYDAAHRLYRITDARSNSVTYTLDNAGNRTGEEIKDSSGTLLRSITRSFDALNRVQQVTGAAM
jgi:YD repeat-containing protein